MAGVDKGATLITSVEIKTKPKLVAHTRKSFIKMCIARYLNRQNAPKQTNNHQKASEFHFKPFIKDNLNHKPCKFTSQSSLSVWAYIKLSKCQPTKIPKKQSHKQSFEEMLDSPSPVLDTKKAKPNNFFKQKPKPSTSELIIGFQERLSPSFF